MVPHVPKHQELLTYYKLLQTNESKNSVTRGTHHVLKWPKPNSATAKTNNKHKESIVHYLVISNNQYQQTA